MSLSMARYLRQWARDLSVVWLRHHQQISVSICLSSSFDAKLMPKVNLDFDHDVHKPQITSTRQQLVFIAMPQCCLTLDSATCLGEWSAIWFSGWFTSHLVYSLTWYRLEPLKWSWMLHYCLPHEYITYRQFRLIFSTISPRFLPPGEGNTRLSLDLSWSNAEWCVAPRRRYALYHAIIRVLTICLSFP